MTRQDKILYLSEKECELIIVALNKNLERLEVFTSSVSNCILLSTQNVLTQERNDIMSLIDKIEDYDKERYE